MSARLARRRALYVYQVRLWSGRHPAGFTSMGRFRTKAAAQHEVRELRKRYRRAFTKEGRLPPPHRFTVARYRVPGGSSYR